MKFESDNIVFTPITSLLSEIVDNRGRTCPTAEKGIPLIATNCIGNENLYPVKKNIRHVSLETYNTWFRGHPKPGDVIFVNKGTPGRVCLVPDPIDFCIAQDMVSLRVNEHINNLYLLAAIRAPQVQNQIQQMQVGTMIPHFKKGDFEKLLIQMRDMPTQLAIGKIYFELSQKIDVNERTSKTLEDIAQAIFKSWFIDFDPVKAKMAGEKPAGMDAATAALFPDSMEESELGLIPKGWRIGSLGEIADLQGGYAFKSSSWTETGVPVIKIGSVKPGFVDLTQVSYVDASMAEGIPDDYRVPAGSLVVGLTGYVGQVGLVRTHDPVPLVNQRVAKFKIKSGEWKIPFIYCFTRGEKFKGIVEELATGTAQQNVSNSQILSIPMTIPSQEIQKIFDNSLGSFFHQIINLADENESLKSTRDALLPRLVSGELQISEETLAS